MKVERQPVSEYVYQITLTPKEAMELYGALRAHETAATPSPLCRFRDALGCACPDRLLRVW